MEQNIKITVAAARVNAGYTQEQAAKKIGVTKATLINWEKGKSIPQTDKAQIMADLYKIPLQFIIFEKKSTVA